MIDNKVTICESWFGLLISLEETEFSLAVRVCDFVLRGHFYIL